MTKPTKKTLTVGDIIDKVNRGEIDLSTRVTISLSDLKKDAAGRQRNKQH